MIPAFPFTGPTQDQHRRWRPVSQLALLLAAVGACGSQLRAEETPAFLPHRAIYELTLAKAGGSGAPAAARGRIVYEFTGSACEGYVTSFRQITQLQMEEGGGRTTDMRSKTYEEGDGSGFVFKTETFMDGSLVETLDGKAQKAADGAIAVNLTKPASAKAEFAGGAFFPTAQMQLVVAAARKGEHTTEAPIFDGSDTGQKIFDTLSVIGAKVGEPPSEKVAADAESLRKVPRWPVTVSYFDPAKQDGTPNYVLGFDLYENGVSGKLRIDYGAYALNGEMTRFEVLPVKACAK